MSLLPLDAGIGLTDLLTPVLSEFCGPETKFNNSISSSLLSPPF